MRLKRLPLKVRCHAVSFFGIHSPLSHSAGWYCQPCNSPASPRLCLLPPQVRFHPLSILTSSQRPKTSLCLGHPCLGSANVCTGLTSCLVQPACGMFYRCPHYTREDTQTLGRVIWVEYFASRASHGGPWHIAGSQQTWYLDWHQIRVLCLMVPSAFHRC